MIITSDQLKAARALAGWAQQDLARAANVATSTIADFERGQRTPVANNLRAIRETLETRGIIFLDGGVVKGHTPPKLGSVVSGGVPLKWVDATDLKHWADRRDGQDTLSELLRYLIRAAVGFPKKLDFQSVDSIHLGGWDGICEVDQGHQYVPLGYSGWELTTESKTKKKADEGYEKRSRNPLSLNPASTAFVFVTLRRWSRKRAWADAKRKEGPWTDVRAYDADDLEQWIELFPRVGHWLAVHTNKRPPGIRSLDEAWEEWSWSTIPYMSTELVLTGRDQEAAYIWQWLLHDLPSVKSVQAESPDEAIAFLKASIDQLPSDYRDFFHARCLIAQTPDQARTLVDSTTPMILVLEAADAGLAARAAQHGHYVYMPFGSEAGVPADVMRLSRPPRDLFERALRNMGLPEQQARSVAREAGRSLVVFRRLKPYCASSTTTEWSQPSHAPDLLALLLAGAWDESKEGDKAVLAQLAGESYDVFATRVNRWAITPDSPLRHAGTAWKIAAPRDAWFQLAPFLTPHHLKRFAEVVIDVLGTPDPRFDLAPDERRLAAITQKEPKYSNFLRTGLAETLVLLAVFGDQAKTIESATDHAQVIIAKLLDNANAQRWWSISPLLSVLAEAAPETFLDAVDDSLDLPDRPVMALFAEDKGPFLGMAYHTELLWALETLAWSPSYLPHVTQILARLSQLDPGGHYGNRPSGSLRKIFLFWSPQTYTTLDDRLKILDILVRREPKVAWELMLELLPKAYDTVNPSPLPRWRDFTTHQSDIITYHLRTRGEDAISKKLVDLTGTDAARWQQVLESLINFPPLHCKLVIEKLTALARTCKDKQTRFTIWTALRTLLHRHRHIPNVQWALPVDELGKFDKIYSALSPREPIQKIAWLFSSDDARIPHPTGDWETDKRVSDTLRQAAIQQLIDDRDVDVILALAQTSDVLPHLVGVAVARAGGGLPIKDTILQRSLNDQNEGSHFLAYGLIKGLIEQDQHYGHALLERAKTEDWSIEAITRVLLALPAEQPAWEQAASYGQEVETLYWSRVSILWVQGEPENIAFAIEKLLAVQRARHAVHLAGHALHGLPTALLIRMLTEAASTPIIDTVDRNEVVMFQHYVEQILNYLDEVRDVEANDLARLEWMYLPLLRYSQRTPIVLHKAMSTNPTLFVDVLSMVFKSAGGSHIEESTDMNIEQVRARAARASDLLHSWRHIPGKNDGSIDASVLEKWVKDARRLCAQKGRADIGDYHIGQLFGTEPKKDPDGAWPIIAIRDVIEKIRSRHLERGILIGTYNGREVTSRSPLDGGEQERTRAGQYRIWAEQIKLEWPRTSALLKQIAEDFERDGRWHDHHAEQTDWLY